MQIARRQNFHADPRASGQTSHMPGEGEFKMTMSEVWQQEVLQACWPMLCGGGDPRRIRQKRARRPSPLSPPSAVQTLPETTQQARLSRARAARNAVAFAACLESSSAEVVAVLALVAVAAFDRLAGLQSIFLSLRRQAGKTTVKRG